MSRGEALTLTELPAAALTESRAAAGRIAALVAQHSKFVWRSLVRLGVPRADAEDAVQQVFLVATRKLAVIETGRESAFLFCTAQRIAWHARRTQRRRREVLEDKPHDRVDPAPDPEEMVDRGRARAALDAILESMPLDLRAVFVLFELEQMTMAAIAVMLELPPGTVASRLRRAREHFQAAVRRLEARGHSRDECDE
ncbi:sigma-70 family RNA polymerase sigma factor [Sorangium sp. So ce1014]|uniref:RNA polymerase sigma factor n=1 Tax=Sorangium sp. So ce1014 TaxID=3133326 RepID=UPI003F5F11EA